MMKKTLYDDKKTRKPRPLKTDKLGGGPIAAILVFVAVVIYNIGL